MTYSRYNIIGGLVKFYLTIKIIVILFIVSMEKVKINK